ncbi:MAG: NUDIX domain-containing protein [Candidatus Hydrogenedentes bacterium]|nr:NUDIX domain-containing protein [Candidatus Hydrogenedentota bacterium]
MNEKSDLAVSTGLIPDPLETPPQESPPSSPRVRVAAVIVEDGKLLMVRHVKGNESYWLLPGGGVDYGESLTEALERELVEEASVKIRVGDLVLANDSIAPDRSRHTVNLYFEAEIVSGVIQRGIDERVVEVRFIPLDELSSIRVFPDVREPLLKAIACGFTGTETYLGKLWKPA